MHALFAHQESDDIDEIVRAAQGIEPGPMLSIHHDAGRAGNPHRDDLGVRSSYFDIADKVFAKPAVLLADGQAGMIEVSDPERKAVVRIELNASTSPARLKAVRN